MEERKKAVGLYEAKNDRNLFGRVLENNEDEDELDNVDEDCRGMKRSILHQKSMWHARPMQPVLMFLGMAYFPCTREHG